MSKTITVAETPSEKIRYCVNWFQVFMVVGREKEASSMLQKLLTVADDLEVKQ
tara:strand:+ start:489 stop:647 length:159 start_codon:yes stop_codon:yes gene_type:complete